MLALWIFANVIPGTEYAALATLSTAVENAVSKGDEIQAAREAVE